MDIYASPGTRVRFTGHGGYEMSLKWTLEKLKVGQILTVKKIDVGRSMSEVTFYEFPDEDFNTVMFEEVKECGCCNEDIDTNNIWEKEYLILNEMYCSKKCAKEYYENRDYYNM